MGESEVAARLRRLDLSNNGLGCRDREVLASSGAELTSLSWLDLHLNRLGDDGLRALCDAPWLGRVEELSLRNNRIGVLGMSALGESSSASLRSLDLSFNPVGSEGSRQLASWPGLAQLDQLGLWGCELSIEAVAALVSAGGTPRLRSLDLGSNGLGPGVVDALRSGSTELSELNLALNHLGDDGARSLAAWPEVATLNVLKLEHNGIGDAGHRALQRSPYLADNIKSALKRART
jgi:Ran GTPase-activating protein (RanGAP) involved in mRNA processing and transport